MFCVYATSRKVLDRDRLLLNLSIVLRLALNRSTEMFTCLLQMVCRLVAPFYITHVMPVFLFSSSLLSVDSPLTTSCAV